MRENGVTMENKPRRPQRRTPASRKSICNNQRPSEFLMHSPPQRPKCPRTRLRVSQQTEPAALPTVRSTSDNTDGPRWIAPTTAVDKIHPNSDARRALFNGRYRTRTYDLAGVIRPQTPSRRAQKPLLLWNSAPLHRFRKLSRSFAFLHVLSRYQTGRAPLSR